MTARTRIAIVDDQSLARMGVAALLEQDPDIEIVAQGRSAADAIALARIHRPDILLLETRVCGHSRRVKDLLSALADGESVRVIVLTEAEDEETVCAAMGAGARAFLPKARHKAELLDAVRTVQAGETYVSPSLAGRLLLGRAARTGVQRKDAAAAMSLDERIMRLVSRGYSNREIARDLDLTETTVVRCVNGVLARMARDHGVMPRPAEHSESLRPL